MVMTPVGQPSSHLLLVSQDILAKVPLVWENIYRTWGSHVSDFHRVTQNGSKICHGCVTGVTCEYNLLPAVTPTFTYNMPKNVHERVADIQALSIDIGTNLSEGHVSGHLMIQEVAQCHHQCAHGPHPWHLPLHLPYSHPFPPHQYAHYSHHQPPDQLNLLTPPVLLQGAGEASTETTPSTPAHSLHKSLYLLTQFPKT